MEANAISPGNNQAGSARGYGAADVGSLVAYDNSVVGHAQAALQHKPGIAADWTAEEQALLEQLLNVYAYENNIAWYAKIAMHLRHKTIRDVVIRCRWMNIAQPMHMIQKNENSKQIKEHNNSGRKKRGRKRKVVDPAAASATHAANGSDGPAYAQSMISMDGGNGISSANYSNGPPFAQSMISMDGGDGIPSSNHSNSPPYSQSLISMNGGDGISSEKHSNGTSYAQSMISVNGSDRISSKVIGGPRRHLIERTAQLLNQISSNLEGIKIYENVNLFWQAYHNILKMLEDVNEDVPESMKSMPPLPVKPNEELLNSILVRSSLKQSLRS
ncbi:hypothetical protein NMG60_11027456 [Bertholletia excelsa]